MRQGYGAKRRESTLVGATDVSVGIVADPRRSHRVGFPLQIRAVAAERQHLEIDARLVEHVDALIDRPLELQGLILGDTTADARNKLDVFGR
jgi:hypothetical protein